MVAIKRRAEQVKSQRRPFSAAHSQSSHRLAALRQACTVPTAYKSRLKLAFRLNTTTDKSLWSALHAQRISLVLCRSFQPARSHPRVSTHSLLDISALRITSSLSFKVQRPRYHYHGHWLLPPGDPQASSAAAHQNKHCIAVTFSPEREQRHGAATPLRYTLGYPNISTPYRLSNVAHRAQPVKSFEITRHDTASS